MISDNGSSDSATVFSKDCNALCQDGLEIAANLLEAVVFEESGHFNAPVRHGVEFAEGIEDSWERVGVNFHVVDLAFEIVEEVGAFSAVDAVVRGVSHSCCLVIYVLT
jgi:hypothetical protein